MIYEEVFARAPQKYLEYCRENDEEGVLSDIFSAICEDEYRLRFWHKKEYWQKEGNKEREIFANLFSLEAFGDTDKLNFLEEDFPEILEIYRQFEL